MIILTAAEADKVRGLSPTVSYAALDPVPLTDGTFMLNEEVLSDPAHADVRPFLAALSKRTVLATEAETDALKLAAVPKWQDAGKRPSADIIKGGK